MNPTHLPDARQKNMTNPPTWTAKYLGLFAGLFFLAAAQYCWANPAPVGQTMLIDLLKPVLVAEAGIVILEMFLLRWLLALTWRGALQTAFMANLVSLVGGALLVDKVAYGVATTSEVFLGTGMTGELAGGIIVLLILLLFAMLLEGLTIKIFNWRLAGRRIVKASVIANCISYPPFIAFMALAIDRM
jgi:hypothetical protein